MTRAAGFSALLRTDGLSPALLITSELLRSFIGSAGSERQAGWQTRTVSKYSVSPLPRAGAAKRHGCRREPERRPDGGRKRARKRLRRSLHGRVPEPAWRPCPGGLFDAVISSPTRRPSRASPAYLPSAHGHAAPELPATSLRCSEQARDGRGTPADVVLPLGFAFDSDPSICSVPISERASDSLVADARSSSIHLSF